ncbi:MAG TPA: hypothetical protein VG253_14275 [Streptosporangiaceae bacterium]|nr:hypothetical protein [Streptosporangiaceae bacterium]
MNRVVNGPVLAMRALCAVRSGYGLALLCAPGAMIRAARVVSGARGPVRGPAGAQQAAGHSAGPAGPAGPAACRVARVLGARHIAQAAALCAGPARPARLAAGAAVDATHAASMITLALAERRVRRQVLADTAVELAFALAGSVVAAAARARR